MRHAKATLAVILGSAVYLTLAIFSVNYAFGVLPGFDWFQDTFGRLTGMRIWSHSAHAIGLFVAATPPALLLGILGQPHALRCAAMAGVLTSAAAFVPSFIHPAVGSSLDASDYVLIAIDSVKMVLILMFVTWLITKLPSNYAMQRSALVVTPLAPSARGVQKLQSASGAPTARRR